MHATNGTNLSDLSIIDNAKIIRLIASESDSLKRIAYNKRQLEIYELTDSPSYKTMIRATVNANAVREILLDEAKSRGLI